MIRRFKYKDQHQEATPPEVVWEELCREDDINLLSRNKEDLASSLSDGLMGLSMS